MGAISSFDAENRAAREEAWGKIRAYSGTEDSFGGVLHSEDNKAKDF